VSASREHACSCGPLRDTVWVEVERVDDHYAWAVCTCLNTIKFAERLTFSCCAACGTFWRCGKPAPQVPHRTGGGT